MASNGTLYYILWPASEHAVAGRKSVLQSGIPMRHSENGLGGEVSSEDAQNRRVPPLDRVYV